MTIQVNCVDLFKALKSKGVKLVEGTIPDGHEDTKCVSYFGTFGKPLEVEYFNKKVRCVHVRAEIKTKFLGRGLLAVYDVDNLNCFDENWKRVEPSVALEFVVKDRI